ncbi:hypothetical protein [Pseudoteredinibacter isoporae]|uniref:Uncharacterized protein n=1 Tax=Pseudoteredinibacter isoporae TaxID=570281 RepID=A0A7X0JS90_9GAMM|nr:hypothetical protein [Pseudoteredinibacter isoporae]MBB6521345.1 hypothetical protein [Pseudoteredinibacter isoporae]NHO86900.1 hypothetical protein [Pseudoteredinibacter isoporae]NIB24648.1 hypothetical protein [Pseudoteredinibacter isoporae]
MSYRSIKLTIITVLSTLCLSAGLFSHAEAPEGKAIDDDKKVVCKKYRPTGTRITKKTCMSKRGWKEIKRRAQDAARLGQRLSTHFNKSDPRRQQ